MNHVPYIMIGICLLAVFAGWSMNRSGKDYEEVSFYLLILVMGSSFWFLLNQTWPAWMKFGFVGLVSICFLTTLFLTRAQADELPSSAKNKKISGSVQTDYPLKCDDFFESGYEDRQGNRVPLGS